MADAAASRIIDVKRWLVVLFLLGTALRFVHVWRSVDLPNWREADEAALARNYYREGMNLFYPRIDYRGSGPGYAEMEFPLYPWTMALLYQIFGIHEWLGRLLSFGLSLMAMGVFFAFARGLLPARGAMFACGFYALSRLAVYISHSMQPEGLMFACELIAVAAFWRWLHTGERRAYWTTTAATALAILAKAPAAHIGVLFLLLLLWKRGFAWLRDPRIWLFGVLTLLPSALWYRHAYHLYRTYGNSLGVSNQTHWAGLDLVRHPKMLFDLIGWDVWLVWTAAGVLIALYALWHGRRQPVVVLGLCWIAAIALYYLIAARTLSAYWASYYHVVAVPPAALLFGLGADYMRRPWLWLGIVLVFLQQARGLVRDIRYDVGHELYACSRQFRPALTKPGLVLASGGVCRDEYGKPVAYNASYFFLWLERKGWNVCEEEQSLNAVRNFAAQGAVYFIAEKEDVAKKPGFEQELRAAFPIAAECDAAWVFDLSLRSNIAPPH